MKIDLLPSGPALIIGLMSGTSADGIDAALMEIDQSGDRISWRLRHHAVTPWPAPLREAILDACRADAPAQQLTALNFRLGEEFARAAAATAEEAGLQLSSITAIASHGQTVWHQPEPILVGGVPARGTLQLGEPSVIAAQTGCIVVGDFRCADMAVGGQGAPLVPFADFLLFADAAETRAVQNIGGIANVALLPAGGALEDVVAFDTGPGNMVIDALVGLATAGQARYDLDGRLAAQGSVNADLLAKLLQHPYFSAPPPKSTGREMFGAPYAEQCYEHATAIGLAIPDILATATALTVESIVRAYQDHLLPRGPIGAVILGGGGTHNSVIVDALRNRLAPARLAMHADFGMPDDAKEAAAFALLGYSTLRGRPSNVPSATGASARAVLGKICLPPHR